MFEEFPKIARLTRDCVITEKIDGTNAQVHIIQEREFLQMDVSAGYAIGPEAINGVAFWLMAGSRTRYINPDQDNHGFAAWVWTHAPELFALGEGRHYGEWWGSGVQRGYGLTKGEKRWSLFNVARWADDRDREKFTVDRPACCSVVPVLYSGGFSTEVVGTQIERLRTLGSVASPGFTKPEGVIVWHEAARVMFKKTLEKDAEGKEQKDRRLARA